MSDQVRNRTKRMREIREHWENVYWKPVTILPGANPYLEIQLKDEQGIDIDLGLDYSEAVLYFSDFVINGMFKPFTNVAYFELIDLNLQKGLHDAAIRLHRKRGNVRTETIIKIQKIRVL